MPRSSAITTPKYRRHKPSGQAVVTIDNRDFYLGPFGSKSSCTEYDRLIGEWLTAGRRLAKGNDMAVVEIINAFRKHVEVYHANPGGSDGEIQSYRLALKKIKQLYGDTPAHEFGPLALKTVRNAMIQAGWSRTYVNSQIGRVRAMFKWAAGEEMLCAETWHALKAVEGLRQGKTEARESTPTCPAPQELIDAIVNRVAPQVRAMIELQILCGMRPGEVCIMRGCDLDTTGKLWTYTPSRHKTQHRGHERTIYLGRRCQEVIKPFLKSDVQAYLFSPADADAWHREQRRVARKTPLSCGNRAGTNRVNAARRRPREKYSVISYGQAINRACELACPPPPDLARRRASEPQAKRRETYAEWKGRLGAEFWKRLLHYRATHDAASPLPTDLARQQVVSEKPPRWESNVEWKIRLGPERWSQFLVWRAKHSFHPHQLRHSAATRLRKEYGLEAAQVILGHKTLSVTQIYAQKNVAAAQKIMAEVG